MILTMILPAGSLAETVYPVTLTDQAGRQVIIESEPERLVSCYYIATSLLMALDLEDRLAGVENQANLRPIYGLSTPQLLDLPGVGTAKELDIEACAALEPDLVILPLRLKGSADLLEELGMDVLLVNPESQTLLEEMIRLVGAATNTGDRAAELTAFAAGQRTWLNETLAGASRPRVYLAGNSSMLSTAGSAMYQSDLIHLAGGANVAAQIEDAYWCKISYEQLLTWNPEYIVLASAAKYDVQDVLSDPNLAACDAVANGRVVQTPSYAEAWDSPVPGSILGAVWLASVLHPELVSPSKCEELIDEYYETFYGFAPSEN